MKLNYFDSGAVAKITVTSNLFQYKNIVGLWMRYYLKPM